MLSGLLLLLLLLGVCVQHGRPLRLLLLLLLLCRSCELALLCGTPVVVGNLGVGPALQ
jgi:hypothetical protein